MSEKRDDAVHEVTGSNVKGFVTTDGISSLKYLTHMHKCFVTETSVDSSMMSENEVCCISLITES